LKGTFKKDLTFIVLPHGVGNEYKVICGRTPGNLVERLGQNEVLNGTKGFQKVRTYGSAPFKREGPDTGDKEKVRKCLKDWYPAEVEGSDCKCMDDVAKPITAS